MTEEFAGGQDLCLGGEELVEQAGIQLRVEVGAAVLDDNQAVIGVGGFAEGGEYDAAGGDAEEDKRFDVVGAEDHFEVGAGEGADAVLGDDDVVRFGSDGGVDRSCGAPEEALVLWRGFDGSEEEIARADFGKIGTKADLYMDDAHSEARARCRTLAARASSS